MNEKDVPTQTLVRLVQDGDAEATEALVSAKNPIVICGVRVLSLLLPRTLGYI